MKPWAVLGFIAVLLMAVPAWLGAAGGAGKAAYDKKCATCHGTQGEGKAAIAKMMKVELHHLGSKEIQAMSDDELNKIITEGKGKMKPVKGLSQEDVANVVAYVRTLKEK